MAEGIPTSAQAVVIGGGVVGCATAYHLAKAGWRDVVLLEKGHLTSGTTWHAAGAVAQYRSNLNVMRLIAYAVELYPRLETETGQATGWRQSGGIRLASHPDRRREYERTITAARSFGLEMHLISPEEAKGLFPLLSVEGVDCALYVPSDGSVGPSDVTRALAKGARQRGARILENTAVVGFESERGAICAVITEKGRIACDKVALCAGLWSRELGKLAGVNVPLWPCQHCYMVSEPIAGLSPDVPVARDPDLHHYFREWSGGLMIGQYELDPLPSPRTPSRSDPEFNLEPENLEHFVPRFLPLIARLPVLETVGVRSWVNGLESFTEDQNPLLGEAPELENFFVCAGFNAYGVSAGAGFGMALAHWMVEGEPPYDLAAVDLRRFQAFHRSDAQVRVRALEGQGRHYAIHYPHEEMAAGRPLRRSPLYERLKAARACFGAKAGWERPNWFAAQGEEPIDQPSFGRPNWFPAVAEECRAVRERAGLFDASSFAKFELIGRDAESLLQRLCANDVGKAPGHIVYTQMLNEHGGIECDLTVCRLAPDLYYIVTGTAAGPHDFTHIRRRIPEAAHARLIDVTSAYGVVSLMGPRARDVLAPLAEADLSDAAFAFGAAREIMVAGAPVRALRITYVGELGYELHAPCDYLLTLYDALKAAGAPFGLKDAGYRAIESLRLEKGYRAFGADVGPDYTPLEAGLSFAVAFEKNVDFIGRAALEAERGKPLKRRLVTIALADPEAMLLGRETIYRNGERIGWLSSGGYGHTLKSAIGLGYVRAEGGVSDAFLSAGRYEVEVALRRYSASVHLRPLYDPEGRRVRGS